MLTYVIHMVMKSNQEKQLTPQSNETLYRNTVVLKEIDHSYLTYGYINGYKVKFIVDTGATSVSIPESIAQKIGLKKGARYQAMTANGTITVYRTYIDKLTIGSITLIDIAASINPSSNDDYILLGMSALRQLELQQKNNELILIQTKW
ncbi:retroviral-like aspartic protease family protein [Thiotrichales bacterium 19S3-7]|nr:retroviral-like aspartic protease family protein [Thiotrichales bacterium 19S3-7]MCF6802027.1 retroviral-like aspartic protease family protein [Thiotrichales bacterium 19S3-11]